MKEHPTHCKFCQRPITLEIDDYYELKDPLGLIRLAACNRCADLRSRRRSIMEFMVDLACRLKSGEDRSAGEALRLGLVRWLNLIHDWTGASIEWDEAYLDAIRSSPNMVRSVLGRMWPITRPILHQPLLSGGE